MLSTTCWFAFPAPDAMHTGRFQRTPHLPKSTNIPQQQRGNHGISAAAEPNVVARTTVVEWVDARKMRITYPGEKKNDSVSCKFLLEWEGSSRRSRRCTFLPPPERRVPSTSWNSVNMHPACERLNSHLEQAVTPVRTSPPASCLLGFKVGVCICVRHVSFSSLFFLAICRQR